MKRQRSFEGKYTTGKSGEQRNFIVLDTHKECTRDGDFEILLEEIDLETRNRPNDPLSKVTLSMPKPEAMILAANIMRACRKKVDAEALIAALEDGE